MNRNLSQEGMVLSEPPEERSPQPRGSTLPNRDQRAGGQLLDHGVGKGSGFAFAGGDNPMRERNETTVTRHAAAQAYLDGYTMVSGGAAASSVFSQNNRTFGFFPPASSYHDNPLGAIAAAAQKVDAGTSASTPPASGSAPCFGTAGGCFASIKVGFIQAAASFTRSQCVAKDTLVQQWFPHQITNSGSPTLVEIPRSPTNMSDVMHKLCRGHC